MDSGRKGGAPARCDTNLVLAAARRLVSYAAVRAAGALRYGAWKTIFICGRTKVTM